MLTIYILGLTNNKYYVGKSKNVNFRLEDHFTYEGSVWTKKYMPVSIVKQIQNCNDYDEDKYTIQYMAKYGIDNVRGGSFCELVLSTENKNTINKMIKGAQNKCFICGDDNHFAKDCTKKVSYKYQRQYYTSSSSSDFYDPYSSSESHNSSSESHNSSSESHNSSSESHNSSSEDSDTCYRCGRYGHYVAQCYAKFHIDGYQI
jgi:cellular nucleic acid-binding protein